MTARAHPAIGSTPQSAATDEPQTNPRVSRSDYFWFGALLIVVMFVIFINFWYRYSLFRLDIVTFYLPWYEQLGERLRAFDIPGWMPYAMSGSPFAGDPQSGWGYLPAMVFFTISPSMNGYFLFLAFHVVLAAASTYLYCRVIGIGSVGAFAAGITFALGNFMERTACCTIHMQVAVWIPAIFLCYELYRRAETLRSRLLWLVLAGIGCGQMVSGWVGQGAYYGVLAVGIYVLYRSFGNRREFPGFRTRIKSFVLAGSALVIVGGATAAPAVLPRLDTISRSNLQDLYNDGDSTPDAGWVLESLPYRIYSWNPGANRWYLGGALLVATILAAVICWRRRHALFFGLYCLGIVLLLVRDSPLIDLFNLLPRFADLHVHSPDRIYVVLYLGPAVLIGWLAQTMRDRSWSARRNPVPLALGTGLVLIGIALSFEYVPRYSEFDLHMNRIRASAVVLFAVLLAAFVTQRHIRRFAVAVLILSLVWDPSGLLIEFRLTNPEGRLDRTQTVNETITANGAAIWLQERSDAGELFRYFGYDQVQLMNNGGFRTYHINYGSSRTWRLLVNNRGIAFHLQDIQGYNPVQIVRYVEMFEAINGRSQSYHAENVFATGLSSPLLNQLDVQYIVVPAVIPPGRPDLVHLSQQYPTVFADGESRILDRSGALGRAWIVHDIDEEDSGERIFTRFDLKLADPSRSVLVVGDGPELVQPDPDAEESVVVTRYEADEIHLTVTAASTGMVVLSEIYDPGWEATVDGEPAKIYAANYALRGVLVPAGTHEIVVSYPATIAKGSLLFYLIPLVALGAIAASYVWARRRS